ncbi:helix-turn-helix domain-containing protein [Streptomyces amakusaensis]|uniref:PucR family transcriptional regulator n=1 Tax=Streptomyces amakusaensis TaxID=67271 RepID=A0ABW0AT81_9ACTN
MSIALSFDTTAESGPGAEESGTPPAADAATPRPGDGAPSVRLEVSVDGLLLGEVRLSLPPGGPPGSGTPARTPPPARPGTPGAAGGGEPPRLGDPALVRVVLSARTSGAERSRALRLLGLRGDERLRVAAVTVADPGTLRRALRDCALALGRTSPSAGERLAPLGVLWPTGGAILLPGSAAPSAGRVTLPQDAAVGLGPPAAAERLPDSWEQACRAARFAGLGPTWPQLMDSAGLGAPALLADVPRSAALAHPDVEAVARLAGEAGGGQAVRTLDVVCRSKSLRDAAELLHLHHSSVAQRVSRIERALGIPLGDPHGRQRAQTALLLWQLNAPGEGHGRAGRTGTDGRQF